MHAGQYVNMGYKNNANNNNNCHKSAVDKNIIVKQTFIKERRCVSSYVYIKNYPAIL